MTCFKSICKEENRKLFKCQKCPHFNKEECPERFLKQVLFDFSKDFQLISKGVKI
jgi:hypothetical protein